MTWCRQETSHVTWANIDLDLCRFLATVGDNMLDIHTSGKLQLRN